MIPTDHLITTIVADHAAQRDADPQAVIVRLKQDLRAARQSASKARARVAQLTEDADATLRAENEQLRAELTTARRLRANALRSLADAKVVVSNLRAENARLRVPQREPAAAPADPDDLPRSIFALEFLELMRAHKLIKALYAAPDGQYAAVANRVLALVAEITATADPWGKGKRDVA